MQLCNFECPLHNTRLYDSCDLLLQIVATVFAVGLAIRYFLTYKEDRFYDQVEKKPKIMVADHKVSPTISTTEQVDGSHPAASASFEELKHAREKTIMSEKGAGEGHPGLKKTMSEASRKDCSLLGTRTKVLERRRTVSEGHCSNEYQSSDDSLAEIRSDSQPPRMEHRERSLEECKSILNQSVCQTLM